MGKPSKRSHRQPVHQVAREQFGYESLRGGQEAAIKALVDGRDTLAVMPTVSGKSLFYCPDDLNIRRFLVSSGQVDSEEVEKVAIAVQKQDKPMKRRELRQQTHLSQAKLSTALNRIAVLFTPPRAKD
jgi:hypothetical protein